MVDTAPTQAINPWACEYPVMGLILSNASRFCMTLVNLSPLKGLVLRSGIWPGVHASRRSKRVTQSLHPSTRKAGEGEGWDFPWHLAYVHLRLERGRIHCSCCSRIYALRYTVRGVWYTGMDGSWWVLHANRPILLAQTIQHPWM